ncbi:type II toxin-antitoxin system PemK/MazF family toxin [Patescibacteria group bacterium]|nr:type II toxin-antitoxin system PemK/MazF family toxin [Patescibacteria group bacterium]MBU1895457.1 type II toxin-antitoxin system PemK/MazF family toxin [Patescibacteria group bacterium]
MLKKGEVKYGDILWTQFDPSVGHEFQDKRPAIVIQTDEQLSKSNLVTLIPLTGNLKNKLVDDIVIEPDNRNNLRGASIVKVYDIVSHDYERITGKIGVVAEKIMTEIKQYLQKHFGI